MTCSIEEANVDKIIYNEEYDFEKKTLLGLVGKHWNSVTKYLSYILMGKLLIKKSKFASELEMY